MERLEIRTYQDWKEGCLCSKDTEAEVELYKSSCTLCTRHLDAFSRQWKELDMSRVRHLSLKETSSLGQMSFLLQSLWLLSNSKG